MAKIALCDARGPLADLLDKLGGESGDQWLEALKHFLRRGVQFPVWRTIKLGTGLKTADDFRKALADNGFKVSDWANDILGQPAFTAATEEIEVDLVVVSNAELGFEKGAKLKDTYARAKELGLELCSPEVGPQLRLQHENQPRGEWLLIAMEPIADSDGGLYVFNVRHGGADLWLYSRGGRPDVFRDGFNQFVFVRRKPTRNA